MNWNQLIQRLHAQVNARTHHERVAILCLVAFLIALFWYCLLQYPLTSRINELKKQIAVLLPEVVLLNKESVSILKESKENAQKTKNSLAQLSTVHIATLRDKDSVMHAILSPAQAIRITELKTSEFEGNPHPNSPGTTKAPTVGEDGMLTLGFEGHYFDTLDYLAGLEKLPWCLAWDSLEYKVLNYPDAAVTIHMHLVKAG